MKTDTTGIKNHIRDVIDDLARKEFQSGMEHGYQQAINSNGLLTKEEAQEKTKAEYQRGLNDAWEAAKKISMLGVNSLEAYGFGHVYHVNVSAEDIYRIFDAYTAAEALQKIQENESQREEIKIGDEVTAEAAGATFVVTRISNEWISGIDFEGRTYSYAPDKIDGKTGRTFPQMAEFLTAAKQ